MAARAFGIRCFPTTGWLAEWGEYKRTAVEVKIGSRSGRVGWGSPPVCFRTDESAADDENHRMVRDPRRSWTKGANELEEVRTSCV